MYHTPVNVFRRPGGYILALTYGQGDWVQNVLASGEAQIRSKGQTHHVENPRVVNDPTRSGVPLPVRRILGVLHVDEFLVVDDSTGASASPS
jgi:deazaflavin-dependent oxidoreductase (nitroreductase family)